MSSLTIKCSKCNKITQFDWQFSNDVTLPSTQCKKCADKFILEKPRQKTENIITSKEFLPFGSNEKAYYFSEEAGMFLFYLLSLKNAKLPILLLTKDIEYGPDSDVCGPFYEYDEYLVQLEDIEKFINTHKGC